jgi:putative membrane protein
MLAAMVLSTLFLLCYVAYHFTTVETRYGGEGALRAVYFFLLITHIIAAGVSLPLILLTFISAWTSRFGKHRSMARWVFPLWLFVAVTGPICYLMLKPYY